MKNIAILIIVLLFVNVLSAQKITGAISVSIENDNIDEISVNYTENDDLSPIPYIKLGADVDKFVIFDTISSESSAA